MSGLEFHEASGLASFLIDSMMHQQEFELSESGILGLTVILRALEQSLNRAEALQHR